jgi:CBS domain-containing protein
VSEVQGLLIESAQQIVLLIEDGRLAGLVTLHDLLRAQTNLAGE